MSQPKDRELVPNAELVNTYWKLVEVDGKPAIVLPNQREAHFVLVAEGSRARGSSGCNQFVGSYETEGDGLSFGPLATTRKMCPGTIMDQEQAFLKALECTTRYEIDGESMDLFADEELAARFVAVYLF